MARDLNITKGNVIKVAQHNLNGARVVAIQLLDHCKKLGVDILLLQETPLSGNKVYGFDDNYVRVVNSSVGGPSMAAIAVLNEDLEVLAIDGLMDRYFAVASVRKGSGRPIVFISAYFKYNVPTLDFTRRMGLILDKAGYYVVLGADVNAHSARWFSRPDNKSGLSRGAHVERLIRDMGLRIHNRKGFPDTYHRRGMGSSNIDVTLSRGDDIYLKIQDWCVKVDVTDSDYRLIRFIVRSFEDVSKVSPKVNRYNVKRIDSDKFHRSLIQNFVHNSNKLDSSIDVAAEALIVSLQNAMKASMPKLKRGGKSKPQWWSKDLDRSKRQLMLFRRHSDYKGKDRSEYRRLRNRHLYLVRKAKFEAWKDFSSSGNRNVWGPLYKWARNGPARNRVPISVRGAGGHFTFSTAQTAECLLGELVPTDDHIPVFEGNRVGRDNINLY